MSDQPSQTEEISDPEAIGSLALIAQELDKLVDATGGSSQGFRVAMLYRRGIQLPVSSPQELGDFLRQHLLPDCLARGTPDTIEHSMQRNSLRDILGKWLDSLPESTLWQIRPDLIKDAILALSVAPSVDALYVLSAAVGYRDPSVVAAFRGVGERNDEIGDTAIRLLAGMRVEGADIEWVRNRIKLRLESGAASSELQLAITILGGDDAANTLFQIASSDRPDWHVFAHFGWLCDLAPGDREYQDHLWEVGVRLAGKRANGWRELIFLGGLVERCHTPRVIDTLISQLPLIVGLNGVHRLGDRLESITSPRQIEAISARSVPPDVGLLQPAAVQPSGPSNPSTTAEGYEKRHSWHIALFFGSPQVFDWLADAVDNDDNTYMQHHIMDRLAVLAVPSLPRRAVELLSDASLRFTRNTNDPKLLPFLGATRLAASQLSVESLRLLLPAEGLTDGSPFRSPVDDAAELAVWLYLRGRTEVIDLLTASLRSGGTMACNTAARALRWMVGGPYGPALPEATIAALDVIARDDGRVPHLRADAVAALTFAKHGDDPSFVEWLVRECNNEEEELRMVAARAIFEMRLFGQYRNAVLACAYRNFANGSLTAGSLPRGLTNHEAHLIGRLSAEEPNSFSKDAAAIVADAFTLASSEAIRGLKAGLPKGVTAPKPIIDAIVQRIRTGESLVSASMFLFDALAMLDPQRLLEERWEEISEEWMADSRQALADSLVTAAENLKSASIARVVELAQKLLGDRLFAVRRSAARSLFRINRAALEGLCIEWIESASILARLRAAEAAAWLPHDDPRTLDNKFQRRLQSDAECRVREAANRSRHELQRRLWAADHSRAIISGNSNDPNDWVLRNFAHGAALAKIGDDTDLLWIRRHMRDTPVGDMPPNVRHWFGRIAEELEKQWRETTRKWPDPWLPWRGSVEEFTGEIVVDGQIVSADFTLWLQPPEDDQSLAEWGGAAHIKAVRPFFGLVRPFSDHYVRIRPHGRSEALALVVANTNGVQLILSGSGPYPTKLARIDALEQQPRRDEQ